MSEQPLQGCILTSGTYMVFAPSWWCPECGVALDTARQLWVSWVFSSQRLSTNVQDVHTLPSPHFLSPWPAVFWWLLPHTHPWVPTGSFHTGSHREVFRMLCASALTQFIQLLKALRTSKMKWHTLLFEETLLILTPFLEVEHVLRLNL